MNISEDITYILSCKLSSNDYTVTFIENEDVFKRCWAVYLNGKLDFAIEYKDSNIHYSKFSSIEYGQELIRILTAHYQK